MPSNGPLNIRALATAALLLTSGCSVLAQTSAPAVSGTAQVNASIKAPERAAQCMACHGPGGVSQIPAIPSLAAQPRVFIENQLVLIRDGLRDIPVIAVETEGAASLNAAVLAGERVTLPAITSNPSFRERRDRRSRPGRS